MYCVIYEFIVDPKQEQKFKDLWHQLTIQIRNSYHSLGSRLHKVIDSNDTWVAYAQWPSESEYSGTPEDVPYKNIRQAFLNTIKGIKILYQMECVDDLLLTSH